MRRLEDGARRIGQGEVDYRIEPDDGGKIGELALAFNEMLDRRHESNAELREAEHKYRTLVENIPAVVYIQAANTGTLTYISPWIERLLSCTPEERLASLNGDWISSIHPDDKAGVVAENERTDEAIWDRDLLTDRQTWNGAVETMFGYPARQQTDSAWWEHHVHPEDRERVISRMDAVLKSGGEMWSEEYRFRRADDTCATVVDRACVVRDEDGGPVRLIGSMMDVT